MTTIIPTHTAKFIAERMRQDLEHAAEKASDYRMKAHAARKNGMMSKICEYAADCLATADRFDAKADRWDAEFKALETICRELTKAGV